MSVEQESLGEIIGNRFGGAQPAKAATDVKPTEKPVEKAAPSAAAEPPVEKPVQAEKTDKAAPRDESGRFKKAESEQAPAEKPTTEKVRPDVAAIIDERKKRQEAEKRYQELLAKQQQPAEKPSIFENEDGAIRSRVDEALRPMREALYNQSIRYARNTYKEAFADAEQAFLEASEKDERLLQGLRESSDPGEYIYMHGIFHKELAGVGGDLLKYREHVTGDLSAKLGERDKEILALKAEIESLKKAQTELESVPRSLNNTSSGPSPKPGEGDDEDIKSITRFGKRNG